MEPRFLELEVELLSSAILTARRTITGFASTLDYIPASTLRGALLSSLYRAGAVSRDFIESEREKPQLTVSPAYPVVDGRKAYPSHPFIYKCKVCKDSKNYASEVISTLEVGREPAYRQKCRPKEHLALKVLHPKPVIFHGSSVEQATVESCRAVAVGISRHRATSVKGMLYDYEAMAAGQRFWATATVPSQVEIQVGTELMSGRGISRGFGRAEVTKVDEVDLREEAEVVANAFRGRRIVLYSFSWLASVSNGRCRPYPTEINLSSIAELCGIRGAGKLEVEAVYGKVGAFSTGWDMLENVERPTLPNACNPGSIAVAKLVAGEIRSSSQMLAALAYTGLVEHAGVVPIAGLNMLVPLRGHPAEGA